MLLAQSFAKNFGLYGERVGTLSVLCKDKDEAARVLSQLKLIIRPMYSSPPIHGALIVKEVLSDAALSKQYYAECAAMAERIGGMRLKLREEIEAAGSTHDWSHVTDQIGMFAFTGMTADMCDELTAEHAIYLTKDGRISIAAQRGQVGRWRARSTPHGRARLQRAAAGGPRRWASGRRLGLRARRPQGRAKGSFSWCWAPGRVLGGRRMKNV